jgi:hypothetical protein
VQPHYPGMGRGLARSLFALVQGTSQLYKGMRYPGIRIAASKWAIVNRDPSRDLSGQKTLWVSRRGTGVTLERGGRLPGCAGEVHTP